MRSSALAESTLTAAQVADQILAVQSRADQVATEWAQRDADARQLQADTAAAAEAVAGALAATQAIESTLQAAAIDRVTGSGQAPSVLILPGDVIVREQKDVLSAVAFNSGAETMDNFRDAQTDLSEKQADLEALQSKNAAALSQLSEAQASLDAQLAELQTLELKLKDEEVKRAYEAKVAALRAQQVAEAAATRAALAAKSPPPAAPRGSGDRPASTPAPATPASTPSPSQARSPGAASQPTSTPDPSPPPAEEPVAAPAPQAVVGGLICPVAGPNAFGDTWGDSRSGGRRHEGVDMMSPAGTPLVAVIAGMANMKTNALGGNTVGLTGSDGNYYYYAHLSAWEGSSRPVRQGDVIGYVGHTGDTSADHLHFGIYAGGGPAINPYPVVRRIC